MSNHIMSGNLFDAVANNDIEGLIYLYGRCIKKSLQLFQGWNNVRANDSFHNFSNISEEKRDELPSQTLPNDVLHHHNSSLLGQIIMDIDNLLNGLQAQAHDSSSDEASLTSSSVIRLGYRERMNRDFMRVPFLPSLFGTLNERSSVNSGTFRNMYSLHHTSNIKDIDSYLFEQAKVFSNARPHVSFVVHGNVERSDVGAKTLSHQDPESLPLLFDGAVANATPIGYDSAAGGGGIGTILHLASAVDSPLALAILLVMGGNASCRHTAFRRLMIHEAACCNSPKCLKLLLELGQEYYHQLQGLGIPMGGGLNYRPLWPEEHVHAHISSRERTTAMTMAMTMKKTNGSSQVNGKRDNVRAETTETKSEFVKILKLCLEYARKVKAGELDDSKAALGLLREVSISDMNKYVIASTCRVDVMNNMKNDCDGHGNTALHWAAFKNSIACAEILLSHNANPNAVASTSGWTPLHDAAYSDSCETLSLLLASGADVNAKAISGATPLCFAAQENAAGATRLLLEAGSDPTIRCCDEQSNIHGRRIRSIANEMEVIHTPQLQLNRFSGYTPLHYCAHYNAHDASRVLLEYHAQVLEPCNISLLDISDLNNKLPIHIAVARGSSNVLRDLLHYGARIDTTTSRRSRKHTLDHDDVSTTSMTSLEMDDEDVTMDEEHNDHRTSSPIPNNNATATTVVTPVSSPVLRSMIPAEPVDSPKPWNCISQRSIDECKMLIQEVEMNWSPERHSIFHPRDRAAVLELLRVGKRLEQTGTGIFLDLWPLVLSFCGRGWFVESKRQERIDSCKHGLGTKP